MARVEFHCHSCYSKDSLVDLKDMHRAAGKKGLDRIVITDHNNFQGAMEAYALDPSVFIMGEEIMTLEGELIGIFMQEFIPPGLHAMQAISLLHQQGAFITIAHPFDSMREGGWNLNDLTSITNSIDAIEVFNARCLSPLFNSRAKSYAHQNQLPGTVGSDAHSLAELGTATLILPSFTDSASLKASLADAKFRTHLSPPWVHFYSRYAAWRKKQAKKGGRNGSYDKTITK